MHDAGAAAAAAVIEVLKPFLQHAVDGHWCSSTECITAELEGIGVSYQSTAASGADR